MYRTRLIKTLTILIALSVLLVVKLVLFEAHKTDSIFVSIINWMIFLSSVGLLIYLVYINKFSIKFYNSMHKDKLIIFITIFVIESVFLIKNQLPFSRVYLFSILLILSFTALISLLLPVKLSKFFDFFILIIYGIYTIGQDTYYRIFNDFFSFKEATTLREGIESGEGMYKANWLYVFIIILIAAAIYLYSKYTKVSHLEINRKLVLRLLMIPSLLFVLIQLNVDYSVQKDRPYTSDHYLYQTVFNRTRFASRFGVSQLLLRDFIDSLIPTFPSKRDVSYIEDYLDTNMKSHEVNAYSGIFKDKNLIFILAESFDEIALSETLTPNIYKLKTGGIDFQNHFTPVFQRTTSDTEFIFNTSLVPSIEDGPTTSTFTNNSYRTSLASLFAANQYTTRAFHGNYKEFYRRHITYMGYGYHAFYGQDEIGLSDVEKKFDTIFYEQSSHLILPDDNPFYSFVISFAGHSPYSANHDVAQVHIDLVEQHYESELHDSIKYYIATQIELDLMLGLLLNDLQAKDILEDTVIVFSSDHYPYTLDQDVYTDYANIEIDFMRHRGNLYIWSSDITPTTIHQLSTSFDILPILNNMFDLGGDYTKYVGNDIFGTPGSIVLFKDYAVFDGTTYLHLADRHATNLSLIEQATRYYHFSKKVLRSNYFKIA
ncbi:LTA synthase family protein [Peloplasma aerotolerans]|uniref:Sulfatase-like hydrolase/transferase n=1 Tax=Peloplasma aerotolerans TaxID=3044389 RepID=A0AAW6U6E8_9MOLU|nr:alkaline phosphatase family protein [Mariniplasma sp. M4Ah]MDI6453467.1 sulfatase-like hydrolase/transferase [Mariniplasma sp. M4Ah]